jgi:hypothetical protein
MALREGVAVGDLVARIERAKGLLKVPGLLPLGFDEMKRILPASGWHNVASEHTKFRSIAI